MIRRNVAASRVDSAALLTYAAGMSETLEIDALGLLCPLPVLRLRKRIAGLPAGAEVTVLADDPAGLIDIPHFCNEAGHSYLGAEALAQVDVNTGAGKAPHRYRLSLG